MSTRLDRLFLLLDTGSTAVIRKSAAEQLGQVQKLHSHELNYLLSKVHGYLGSSNWNTRIAAGQAVNAIARNVPQWQPPFVTKKEENEVHPMSSDQLQLAQFDIEKVLSHGASLLGSEGAEYDVQDDALSLDQKERLTRQKQLLNKRLGLDVAGGLGLHTEDLFKEEDLLVTQPGEQPDKQQSCVKELLRQQLQRSQMSARERNHAKRKAKQLAKQSSKELEPSGNSNDSCGEPAVKLLRSSSGVFEQPDQEKLLVDRTADGAAKVEEVDEWPFEAFCELLTNDLFSALWEKRHGAATGLREVVKCHASGAGKTSGCTHVQMEAANQLWLEDVAVRLICVLALDRFGDFVSDEVVAPVRETCAQTLGLCLRHMTQASVLQTWQVLRQLLVQQQWEVRHGGLLGLKYLLAVRQDMASSLLTLVVPVVMRGLQDGDDDVRAVGASALLPVTDQLVTLLPQYVGPITECLWFTLLDLDDLTASTNSIMSLLSSLLAKIECDTQSTAMSSMTDLMPRLWPFLTHNIASVRKAALETLHTLLNRPHGKDMAEWLAPILADTMRHILQRALLEEKKEITNIIVKVWHSIISCCSGQQLVIVTAPYLGIWFCLMMQPSKIPFDPKMLIHAHHQPKQLTPSRMRHSNAADPPSQDCLCYISGTKIGADSKDQSDVLIVRARLVAARLLAQVCSVCCKVPACGSDSPLEAITSMLLYHLNSKSAIQRYSVALIITHCNTLLEPDMCPAPLHAKLCECLTDGLYYDEIAMSFTRLQTQCHDFIRTLQLTDTYPHGCVLTLEQAHALCTSVYDGIRQQLPQSHWSECDDRRQQLLDLVTETSTEQLVLQNRVQACIAGVLIRLKKLPPTMNPVVRPLMDAVKKETNIELQMLAAENLARLLILCSSRVPCPNPKVIRNLCSMLCADPHTTPVVGAPVATDQTLGPGVANSGRTAGTECDMLNGILTLHTQHQLPVSSGRGRKPASLRRDVSIDTTLCDSLLSDDHPARTAIQVQLRGMMLALTTIVRHCGPDLPRTAGALWQALFTPLETYSTSGTEITGETDETSAQQLVNSLQVLEVSMAAFHPQLHTELQTRLPQLISCLKHRYTTVRHMAARCLGNLGKILTTDTMTCIIETVLPLLDAANTADIAREGAIEAMANLIEHLGVALVPYLVLLVVPLLGCMSDHNTAVRLMSSQCFATLIRLIPLEAGIPNPPAMKNSLVEQKERDRHFIEQLLDGSKLEVHDILVPIKAELRKYQQDGVNWLAFLNKYKLHGILCDDMGLGKTLQSICILASDHRRQKLEYERTGEDPPLPSIVLCPPTLTGHWVYEVDKFISRDYLHPLHYTGPPLERIKLRKLVKKHNLVVASYDVVRNDIEFFSTIRWNYCILDEGHIIKNSKTKLSRAVKQLNCRHRVILSGTPIQNNVLELWSLFDFLLPGFLGSEKQFQVRYGRPILASRDAKSSSKEQEAGALAMEALHRQVLPFILRRLKEDVLHDLPPKIIQDYYCDLSPLQMKLYEDFAKSRAKKTMAENLSEGEKKPARTERAVKAKKETGAVCTHVFQALQYLRKVCDHPALVITKQHPQFPQLMDDLRQQGTNLHDLQHAPKLIALKQLMTDCGIGIDQDDTETPVVNQHRALIFCQLKSMLDIVEKDLLKTHMSNVSYLRLDGSVPTANRHSIVTRFNNDPSIDLLLLTTHVGGLGLNLTGADTVIFVEHDWNPMKDLQAMDRAHRIGQKNVVNVYRLITRGTLEEKIMGLQKFKMNIANSVISADNSSLSSMATDQLLDLFSVDEDKTAALAAKTEATVSMRQNAQSVIEGLEELWDEKQYETEYDLKEFLSELKQ